MYQFFVLLFLLISSPLIAVENLALTTQPQGVTVHTPSAPLFVSLATQTPDVMYVIVSHLDLNHLAKLARTCSGLHDIIVGEKHKAPLLEHALEGTLHGLLPSQSVEELKRQYFMRDMGILWGLQALPTLRDLIANLSGYFRLSSSVIKLNNHNKLQLTSQNFNLALISQNLENWKNSQENLGDLCFTHSSYPLTDILQNPGEIQGSGGRWPEIAALSHEQIPPIPVNFFDNLKPVTHLNHIFGTVAPLYKPLQKLTSLNLLPSHSDTHDSWFLETPAQYAPKLEKLEFWDIKNDNFLELFWQYLPSFSCLKTVTFAAEAPIKVDLTATSKLSTLEELTFVRFKIQNLDLTQLPSLRSLGCYIVTPTDLGNVMGPATLKSFKFSLTLECDPNHIPWHPTTKHLTKRRNLEGGVVEAYHEQ